MDMLTVGLVTAITIVLGAIMGHRKPEDEVWRSIGIKNSKGKYPILISKNKVTGKTTYILYIPDGIDMGKMFIGGKWHYILKQSFGQMKQTEVEALDGHRLAVTVFHGELADELPFKFEKGDALKVPIGESLKGVVYLELGDSVPHVLMAGETGGGKSTMQDLVITWLVLHDIELHLVDLKGGIQHKKFANCRSVKSCSRTVDEGLATLRQLSDEMDRRIDLLYKAGAKHYTEIGLRPIVLAVDEFADFDSGEAQDIFTMLGRKSRAAGIFTITATQRPDSKVMNGSYKNNIPGSICFRMRDHYNSQIVLGHAGAEKLPGKGRCFFSSPAGEVELQGYYLSDKNCKKLIAGTYEEKKPIIVNTSGEERDI